MGSNRNEQILCFIDRLSTEIRLARELSLAQTARILEMAKLDLQTIAHSISDDELRILTLSLEDDPSHEEFKN